MDLLINAIAVCFVISALFVLARIYFVYFAESDCTDNSKCDTSKEEISKKDLPVSETSTKTPAYKGKSKLPRKPKAKADAVESATKKPVRKKKS